MNCSDKDTDSAHSLQLKWHKSHPTDSKERACIGLKWILSYLGAELPKGSFDDGITWRSEQVFELNIKEMGFSSNSLFAWKKLLSKFKSSQAYQTNGSMDLGRFVMLTFNSTWHYYVLTGVPNTYDKFLALHEFDDDLRWQIHAEESCVSNGVRHMQSSQCSSINEIAHIAEEGNRSQNEKIKISEFEVFDYMSNGQPRFAIYDLAGNLKPAAHPLLSKAGKPSKCMWCHESQVSATFLAKTETEGLLSLLNVNEIVLEQNEWIMDFHTKRNSDLDFTKIHQHELAELLYVGFSFPDSVRLASEFSKTNIAFPELEKLKTTAFKEYKNRPGFEKTFLRNQIDSILGADYIKTPHMRNVSNVEPNFLN